MTRPRPESHPNLEQPGPHSTDGSCSPSCAFLGYGWKLPSLPAKWVGICFVVEDFSILIFSIKMLFYRFSLLLLQVRPASLGSVLGGDREAPAPSLP